MNRSVLIATIIIASSISFGCPSAPSKANGFKGKGIGAVSLKVLQARLKKCISYRSCPTEYLQLANLKKIYGVVVDEKNHDLIIWGLFDSNLPPLHLEDLVVALRNAWVMYASIEGDTRVYSYPGCSIDPTEQAVRGLDNLKLQMSRNASGEQEKFVEEWRNVCQTPQTVSVFGAPFNTHFAKVMVEADYGLKSIADGATSLDIPGFTSITDMHIDQVRRQVLRRQPVSITPPSMNRFWFYPGETIFEEGQGMIFIKQCYVRLLTEQMYSNAQGKMVGAGKVEPFAGVFANNVTALYGRIAQQREIYFELDSLFRFVALAKIVSSRLSGSASKIDLGYLLNEFPLPNVSVSRRLPGRAAVKDFRHEETFQNARRTFILQVPSCGGVDIAIEANPGNIIADGSGRLSAVKAGMLGSRAYQEGLFWEYQSDVSDLTDSEYLLEMDRLNKEARVITIFDNRTGYWVYSGDNHRIYGGNSITDLFQAVNQYEHFTSGTGTLYLDLKGFATKEKVEAFITSFNIQQSKLDKRNTVRSIARKNNSTESLAAWMLPGVRYDGKAEADKSVEVKRITEGRFKDRFSATMQFFVRVKGKTQKVSVTIIAKTKEALMEFVNMVLSLLIASDYQTESLSDIFNQARRELKTKHGWSDDDLILIFTDQFDETHIVELSALAAMEVGE